MADVSATASDSILFTEQFGAVSGVTISEILAFAGVLSPVVAPTLHEVLAFTHAFGIQFNPGAVILEHIKIHPTLATRGRWIGDLSDELDFLAKLHVALGEHIHEDMTIGEFMHVAIAVHVLDSLLARDGIGGVARYKKQIGELIRLNWALGKFLGGTVVDHIGLSHTIIPFWRLAAQAHSGFSLLDDLTPQLIIRMELFDDGWEFNDELIPQMIFDGQLADEFHLSAGFLDPSGGLTTWAINTRTAAVTEYEGYEFNSFAQMGHHFVGAARSGLWLLEGALDGTDDIHSRVRAGIMSLGGSHFTSFKGAYLGLRVRDGRRDFVLRLLAGDGRNYVYKIRPKNMMTSKVNMGKGLRSRYFQWELEAWVDYDLDSIEFIPISTQRRV